MACISSAEWASPSGPIRSKVHVASRTSLARPLTLAAGSGLTPSALYIGHGQNAFEVRCKLSNTPAWFRPGMEGQARFNTQNRSIAWIASRRIIDTLKVWLWW